MVATSTELKTLDCERNVRLSMFQVLQHLGSATILKIPTGLVARKCLRELQRPRDGAKAMLAELRSLTYHRVEISLLRNSTTTPRFRLSSAIAMLVSNCSISFCSFRD
jgi:hypothetical protein